MSNNWNYILEKNLYDACINEDIGMLKMLLDEVGVKKINDINLLIVAFDKKNLILQNF